MDSENVIQKFSLNFTTNNQYKRQIVLGFSDLTSEAFDYGYDGKMSEPQANYMYTLLEEDKMITQAYSKITSKKSVPLSFVSEGKNHSITISNIENINKSVKIYLLDHYTNRRVNLQKQDYSFTSEKGEFNNRFEIVFQASNNTEVLDTKEFETHTIKVYAKSKQLYIKGLQENGTGLSLYNVAGQKVLDFGEVNKISLENGLSLGQLTSGVYLVQFSSMDQIRTEKIILK